jgi:hypothetical protein
MRDVRSLPLCGSVFLSSLCAMEDFVRQKQKEILIVQPVGDLTVFRHVVEDGTSRPIREGKPGPFQLFDNDDAAPGVIFACYSSRLLEISHGDTSTIVLN